MKDTQIRETIECPYKIEGTGEPLFLIHGIGASKEGWDRVVEGLRDHFQCISYDLRGHGQAPLPDGPFGLDDLVADLEALREKLGIGRAYFAGHSLGGMIGPAYARLYPERVAGLGLLSTAAGRTAEDGTKVQGVVARMEEEGIPEILPTLVDRWFTDDFAAANPDAIERRLKQVLDTDPRIFLNVFHIYAETEMAPWLHEVKAPSLVLTGELDGGCNPRLNRFIHGALENSRLEILPGLKHSLLIEAPAQLAAALRHFFLSLGDQPHTAVKDGTV